jgi:hypothetical protein
MNDSKHIMNGYEYIQPLLTPSLLNKIFEMCLHKFLHFITLKLQHFQRVVSKVNEERRINEKKVSWIPKQIYFVRDCTI